VRCATTTSGASKPAVIFIQGMRKRDFGVFREFVNDLLTMKLTNYLIYLVTHPIPSA
jgi:hypothetical protein